MAQQPSVAGLSCSARQAAQEAATAAGGLVSWQATTEPPVPPVPVAPPPPVPVTAPPAPVAAPPVPVAAPPVPVTAPPVPVTAPPVPPVPVAEPITQFSGIAFITLSPQTPSDTAIESCVEPGAVQANVVFAPCAPIV